MVKIKRACSGSLKALGALCGAAVLAACAATGGGQAQTQSLSAQTVLVSKNLGLRQCEQTSVSEGVELLRQQLKEAGITVMVATTTNDGRAYATMCGGPTGDTGVFAIPKDKQAVAEDLGFRAVRDRNSLGH